MAAVDELRLEPQPPQAAAAPAQQRPQQASSTHDALDWLLSPLHAALCVGGASSLLLLHRHSQLSTRLAALAEAPPLSVEQLQSWWDKQQTINDLLSSNSSSAPQQPLPPQYLALTGRTACDAPMYTRHTEAPRPMIWLQSFHIRRFFRLFPCTALKMYEVERKDAHCESRDFQLTQVHSAAAAAASPSVHVPSSLPCESRYLRGLVREVSDVTRDVTLSSTSFMQQLASGQLQVAERHIERAIPVGQPLTVVGFVHRDANTGQFSVMEGGGGAQQDALSSGIGAPAPDLQAFAYSSQRPMILSHLSPQRLVEEERMRVAGSRRWLLFAVGATLAVGAVVACRYLYRVWDRNQQMRRLVEFHALRRERRAQQRKERNERERRRATKKRVQAQELATRQAAQLAYMHAAAVSGMTPAYHTGMQPVTAEYQQEGMPHFPAPLQSPPPQWQQQHLQLQQQQLQQQQQYNLTRSPAPHASPPSVSSSSRPQMQQQQQQLRGAPAMRSPSPYGPVMADAGVAHSSFQRPHAPLAGQSVLPAPVPLFADPFLGVELHQRVDDAASDASADDASGSEDDERSGARDDDDGADDCVICAEHRADACLVQCGHMYTCMFCAQKLSRCPICRCAVERVVKVFAQQM